MARTSWLYAELFVYVRIVTVHASLSAPESVQDAVVNIAADGRSISLLHQDERISIDLPTRVRPQNSSTSLKLSLKKGNQFTLRLNVEDELTKGASDSTNDSDSLMSVRSENPAPWTSRSMTNYGCQISCAQCGSNIQSTGKVRVWLDLPNENWADLMEFWHCHKPAENQEAGWVSKNIRKQSNDGKGYFAANGLRASRGKGFIGTSYFLLHEDDCNGAKIKTEDSTNARRRLQCSNCGGDIGNTDPLTGGWKLEKWSLLVHPRGNRYQQEIVQLFRNRGTKYEHRAALLGISEQKMAQKWISAQLLASAESGSARTFVILNISQRNTVPNNEYDTRTLETTSRPLLLWVFTMDLMFSSSVRAEKRQDPTRAMKIFWKPFEESKSLSPGSLSITSSTPSSNDSSTPFGRQQYRQSEQGQEQEQGQGQGQEQVTTMSHSAHTKPHHGQNTRKALAPLEPQEEISLPPIIFRELCRALESSADYIPESSREFQGWRVGLLERFRESESQ